MYCDVEGMCKSETEIGFHNREDPSHPILLYSKRTSEDGSAVWYCVGYSRGMTVDILNAIMSHLAVSVDPEKENLLDARNPELAIADWAHNLGFPTTCHQPSEDDILCRTNYDNSVITNAQWYALK
jgi:hypothetical protein